MYDDYKIILDRYKAEKKNIKALFQFLNKKSKKDLDSLFYPLYQEIFFQFDCSLCAKCCELLGPQFYEKDIERLASYFHMKKKQFISCYLKEDEDGDYVFQEMPCPFLCDDKKCLIYNDRPKACREFPHLLDGMTKEVLKKTQLNGEYCPAVAQILLILLERFKIKA